LLFYCISCGFIVKKLLNVFYSKYFSRLATTFSHLSGSIPIPRRISRHLLRSTYPQINSFPNILIWRKIPLSRISSIGTNSNQTGQYQESTVVGVGLPISAIPSLCFDSLYGMRLSIVILESYFVVFLLVLWLFFFQCLVQTHQLKSTPIPCNGFIRMEQRSTWHPADLIKYKA